MTPEELGAVLASALARAGEPEAEATASMAERGFARFSVGELGQHMQIVEPQAAVRVARGTRVAEVATTALDEAALVDAIHTAARMAPSLPPDPDFPGFAPNDESVGVVSHRYFDSTGRATADERVERLAPVLDTVERAGLVATGVLDTTRHIYATANTHGVLRTHRDTLANFKIWALEHAGAGGAAGHGRSSHADLNALDVESETARAVRDALRGKDPAPLDPGAYDVVFEPEAVSELVEWLSMIAFGGSGGLSRIEPLADRFGERISGEALTIAEDPLGAMSFAVPFDREGVPRRRVPLIDRGVAGTFVSDRIWAHRMKSQSTGNAAAPSRFGGGAPTASALVVGGGEAKDVEELLAGVERGLYVRRLHYVNGMLEPRRAVMTGLTRDGTFRVENGKVVGAVSTLRFTDSLLEAFERCDGSTRERRVIPNWWSESGSVAAPAVRIRRLRFTGSAKQS